MLEALLDLLIYLSWDSWSVIGFAREILKSRENGIIFSPEILEFSRKRHLFPLNAITDVILAKLFYVSTKPLYEFARIVLSVKSNATSTFSGKSFSTQTMSHQLSPWSKFFVEPVRGQHQMNFRPSWCHVSVLCENEFSKKPVPCQHSPRKEMPLQHAPRKEIPRQGSPQNKSSIKTGVTLAYSARTLYCSVVTLYDSAKILSDFEIAFSTKRLSFRKTLADSAKTL